jgi:hypothetical protein
MSNLQRLTQTLSRFLASSIFFYIILGGFILSALWFVFSAMYPLAFDEDFHLGVIKIYAEQWSPFLIGQPAGGDAFGSLATDPSYLFHYLMSFPYRVIALFTGSEAIQVIWLRLINVALFAWSLVLFKRVMQRAGASASLTNVSLALFVLIPIVPQLAAHINYDNLFMLLLAWLCLVVFRLYDSFRQKRIDVTALFLIVIICLFTGIVKYAALPLLVGAALFVIYAAYRAFRHEPRKLLKSLRGGFIRLSRPLKIILVGAVLLGAVLFAQRYIINIVQYHHPVPDCGKVLTVDQCKQYGPWGRDYNLEREKLDDFRAHPVFFMGEWLDGMRHRLFFAVSGSRTWFANYRELPVITAAFTVIAVAAVVATIAWRRRIFTDSPYLVFFALMTAVYIVLLWIDQYGMYKQTSVPVAINGRYLLPILPLMAVIAGKAFSLTLAKYKAVQLKPYFATAAILLFLQGGGMLTYLLRADSTWYWPNQTIRDVNEDARKTLAPFIIEGDKYHIWK